MKDYLFIAPDGDLFDTRKKNWSKKPLRPKFRYSFSNIRNVNQLKSTLRNGEFAWPGGYPMFFHTSDGAALHFDCVRENLRKVIDSVAKKDNDGWRVVGIEINYESELYCDHCGNPIESAYGEEKEE